MIGLIGMLIKGLRRYIFSWVPLSVFAGLSVVLQSAVFIYYEIV